MVAATLTPVRSRTTGFYVWMAGVCALIAFGSFAGTYWLRIAGRDVHRRSDHPSSRRPVFGLDPSLLQPDLARRQQPRSPSRLGIGGISLATAMVLVGLATSVNSLGVATLAGYGEKEREF